MQVPTTPHGTLPRCQLSAFKTKSVVMAGANKAMKLASRAFPVGTSGPDFPISPYALRAIIGIAQPASQDKN
jgi:hypothetical protein